MSDVYEAYSKLVRLVVLGRVFEVPENNLLLRQLQYVAPDIASGKYCWNAECRYCEIQYRLSPTGPENSGLACRVKGVAGMQITKVALEIKYNLGEALTSAPSDEATQPSPAAPLAEPKGEATQPSPPTPLPAGEGRS